MFINIPPVSTELIYDGEKSNDEKEVQQKFDEGDICPICLDPLENGKDLDYCRYSCGKTIHKKCFSMWERTKGSICVFCRAEWHSKLPVKNHKKVSMHPIIKNENIEEKNNKEDPKKNKEISYNENKETPNPKKDILKNIKLNIKENTNQKNINKKKNRSRSRDKSREKDKFWKKIGKKSKSY